jgi:hypothetical protein
MFQRFSGYAVLVALVGSLVAISPSLVSAQGGNPNTNRLDVPISGVVAGVGTLTGNFAISRFVIENGQLTAVGTLTATVTDTAGNVARTLATQLAMPVTDMTGTCDILTLVLGPLHLDILGLTVDLNQVVLEIAATAGAGNLLGNLLCAIAGLLDAGSLGTQLVNLLNQLLVVLAGI